MILYWVYASSFYFTIYGRTKRLSISSLSAPSIRVTAPDRPTYRSVRSFAVDHDPPKGTPTTQQPECCSSDSDAVGGAPPSPVGVRGWSSIALLGCGGGLEPDGTCPGSGREGRLKLDFTKQKDCQVFEIHRKIERLFNVVHIVFFFLSYRGRSSHLATVPRDQHSRRRSGAERPRLQNTREVAETIQHA